MHHEAATLVVCRVKDRRKVHEAFLKWLVDPYARQILHNKLDITACDSVGDACKPVFLGMEVVRAGTGRNIDGAAWIVFCAAAASAHWAFNVQYGQGPRLLGMGK